MGPLGRQRYPLWDNSGGPGSVHADQNSVLHLKWVCFTYRLFLKGDTKQNERTDCWTFVEGSQRERKKRLETIELGLPW